MTCPYITAALTATSSTTFSQPPLTPPSGEVGIDIFPEIYCKKILLPTNMLKYGIECSKVKNI